MVYFGMVGFCFFWVGKRLFSLLMFIVIVLVVKVECIWMWLFFWCFMVVMVCCGMVNGSMKLLL